jgi:hypothetical protein
MPTSASLVDDLAFIRATRDSGYRGLESAIAELVDNALQARARHVRIRLDDDSSVRRGVRVAVLDDGTGMRPEVLARALQFGGSDRFNDRSGIGRFGMGLPNGSMSQARRVDVWSWTEPNSCFHCWLDLDEVLSGGNTRIPIPERVKLPSWARYSRASSGTLVQWTRCDRIAVSRRNSLLYRLRAELGRIYRNALWGGTWIALNGSRVRALDPLFLRVPRGVPRAVPLGPDLVYEVRIGDGAATSPITVRFSELPIAAWQRRGVEDRRRQGVIGGAGISVVRAGREIDYGWHLMGSKRRENYDDWWRCEIAFDPALDEAFGVTFNKQGIRPNPELVGLLAPDLEANARELNRRVRAEFAAISEPRPSRAARAATRREPFLPPQNATTTRSPVNEYRLDTRDLPTGNFFAIDDRNGRRTVILNRLHPFYDRVYSLTKEDAARFGLESLLLSAVRALDAAPGVEEAAWAERIQTAWSDALAAIVS